ncbi:MAG: putative peptidoglycan binding domain [Thermoleophilia bacterium]|nr:putative peptidoglycan binding domain [Thermoleophilia bacterium]
MSISSIATSMISKAEKITKVDVNSDGQVAGVPFSTGGTAAGGYMVQGGGAPGEPGGSLVKKMLVGGVVGAGVGFGASFLPIAFITNLGPGGWMAKGIMAAAGAALGVGAAVVMHLVGKRKQNLAMQAQAQAAQQNAMVPTPMPAGGATLRAGAKGAAAKTLQSNLHTLGLYKGKLNGTFDSATSDAVRKYEVMKGVMPTGKGSPDVRAAVAQDAALAKQYA